MEKVEGGRSTELSKWGEEKERKGKSGWRKKNRIEKVEGGRRKELRKRREEEKKN